MSLAAQQLLITLARIQQRQQQHFSRAEISKKIQELKYLSAQKKVPQLTLRKELLHLEHRLEKIFVLEESLQVKKRKETTQVTALKRQITLLKKKLAVVHDKDLQHKVDRLSHLLGECLAQQGVKRELRGHPMPVSVEKEDLPQRLAKLKQRLASLPEGQAEALQVRVQALEEKLRPQEAIKHTLLLTPPEIIDVEKELPLPPPPRRR